VNHYQLYVCEIVRRTRN